MKRLGPTRPKCDAGRNIYPGKLRGGIPGRVLTHFFLFRNHGARRVPGVLRSLAGLCPWGVQQIRNLRSHEVVAVVMGNARSLNSVGKRAWERCGVFSSLEATHWVPVFSTKIFGSALVVANQTELLQEVAPL